MAVARIALVLAGGNALGAYQAGVWQALAEAGIEPERIVGCSAEAINGAIIAGNPPHAAARPAGGLLAASERRSEWLVAGRV